MLDVDWMELRLCQYEPSDLWFPKHGNFHRITKLARAICKLCPVSDECLKYARAKKIKFGIWGGELVSRSKF
jgi:WhiB family redox-sensing transcriptional regulator